MRKLLAVAMAVALTVSLCLPVAAKSDLKRIRLSRGSIVMTVADTRPLTVTYTPVSAAEPITWESMDDSVATVDENGVVTAVGRGKTVVKAKTADGLSSSCSVEVRKEGQTVRAKTMTMAVSSMTVRVGDERSLWVAFEPADTTETDLEWTTSDSQIADIDQDGTVTGIALGKATITATNPEGLAATCAVTVAVGSGSTGTTTTARSTTKQAENGEELTAAEARKAVEDAARLTLSASTGIAKFKNRTVVSGAAIDAAAAASAQAGRDIRLQFTSVDDHGGTQGILTIDPAAAKGGVDSAKKLQTGVYTDTPTTRAIREQFAGHYANDLAVVELSQSGSYGVPVAVTVFLDMDKLDADSLWVYSFDPDTNKFKSIRLADLQIDRGDRVRFTAGKGGILLFSDGKLTKQ